MNSNIDDFEKISVFISSKSGCEKYNSVREDLKNGIENTGFAKVFLFETDTGSTLTAEQDYTYRVDDCDVCIFLIDNCDGVSLGVQKEITRAKAKKKKSIYLFCDEKEPSPTLIQQELTGPNGLHYHPIHKFNDFSSEGIKCLVTDIKKIYKYYCQNRFVAAEITPQVEMREDVNKHDLTIDRQMLLGLDHARGKLYKMIFQSERDIKETSEKDNYCCQFLEILFANKSIRQFNTSLFLDEMKTLQSEDLHDVVVLRWKSIQQFFMDSFEESTRYLNDALFLAKKNDLPAWFIKDILIDVRNLNALINERKNRYTSEDPAQLELHNSTEMIFYPLIDRILGDLNNKFCEEQKKERMQSSFTTIVGHNYEQYTNPIIDALAVSLFFGSRTHILLTVERVINLLYFLCDRYDDWDSRVLLLKLVISEGNYRKSKDTISTFNDIMGKMNETDSLSIYKFAETQHLSEKRFISKLDTFGLLGYYFSDKDYEAIHNEIMHEIKIWISDKNGCLQIGGHIISALSDNIGRINSDEVAKFCLAIFENEFYRWGDDCLELIFIMGIKFVSDDIAQKIIGLVISLIQEDINISKYYHLKDAAISIRKSANISTAELDLCIKNRNFYLDEYFMEVDEKSVEDDEHYVQKFVDKIRARNKSQGNDGIHFIYGDDSFETISNIITIDNYIPSEIVMEDLSTIISETILSTKQSYLTKIQAIHFAMLLSSKFAKFREKFLPFMENLLFEMQNVEECHGHFMSKETLLTLRYNFWMLDELYGQKKKSDLFQLITELSSQEDAEKIYALEAMQVMLQNDSFQIIDNQVAYAILQYTLGTSFDRNHNLRYRAVETLIEMYEKSNAQIILRRLSQLMDYDSPHIKKTIIINIEKLKKYDQNEYVSYIVRKAKIDSHYWIRKQVDMIK